MIHIHTHKGERRGEREREREKRRISQHNPPWNHLLKKLKSERGFSTIPIISADNWRPQRTSIVLSLLPPRRQLDRTSVQLSTHVSRCQLNCLGFNFSVHHQTTDSKTGEWTWTSTAQRWWRTMVPTHCTPPPKHTSTKKKRHDMALLRKLQSILVACPNHSAETYG